MTKSDEVTIEGFVWQKRDLFWRICGKGIGVWASKHSGLCQGCNLTERMKKQKEAEARVGA